MYQFIWPLVFLLLPLPFIWRRFSKGSSLNTSVEEDALKVPFFERLKELSPATHSSSSSTISPLFWTLTWLFFIIAAARPVWIGKPIILNEEARNILLTLDVSGSMDEQDFDIAGHPITRLEIVKHLAKDFIQKRQNDNLGLVIFGSEAYTYAPLSPDTKTLTSLLDEIGIGIAGTQTAMGDALAMAVQSVVSIPTNSRIVILMSDGFSNAGVISVTEALDIAKKMNVKVYTIGIGSNKQMVQDFFGFVQMNASLDLDEETLQKIAQETGGQYFRAKSTTDLKKIYDIIDKLETTEATEQTIYPRKEIAFYFILLGLLFWFLAFVIRRRK